MNKMKCVKIVFFTLLGCFSCTHEKQEPICSPPATVSFQQNILPIFNQHCNTSGCHSGSVPSANLNLEKSVAYAQLTRKGKGYVDTLTPQYSVLYASMNSTSNPMPPNGKLDKCTVELVYKWIEQKAKNN
jgi:hypothetical protein